VSETAMTTERRGEELPERWSAQRKTEVVLRVIRGEAIDEVAREIQVPVHEVEEWRRCMSPESSGPFRLLSKSHSRRVVIIMRPAGSLASAAPASPV
jgi:transposase-like protein